MHAHVSRYTYLGFVDLYGNAISNLEIKLFILIQTKLYHGGKAPHHLLRYYISKVLNMSSIELKVTMGEAGVTF